LRCYWATIGLLLLCYWATIALLLGYYCAAIGLLLRYYDSLNNVWATCTVKYSLIFLKKLTDSNQPLD
jgi:hypothetical protein